MNVKVKKGSEPKKLKSILFLLISWDYRSLITEKKKVICVENFRNTRVTQRASSQVSGFSERWHRISWISTKACLKSHFCKGRTFLRTRITNIPGGNMRHWFPRYKWTKPRKETEKNDKRGQIKAANDIKKKKISKELCISQVCCFWIVLVLMTVEKLEFGK